MSAVREDAVVFQCEGASLVGILHVPEREPARIGVLVIVGGPQYRVGSHRQFVLMARSLAQSGYAVLRFDYRGMGDSDGEMRTFESVFNARLITGTAAAICGDRSNSVSVVIALIVRAP